MSETAKARSQDVIVRDAKPVAVILDIDEYQEILERLEDAEDVRTLREMRSKPVHFRKLDEYLEELRHV